MVVADEEIGEKKRKRRRKGMPPRFLKCKEA